MASDLTKTANEGRGFYHRRTVK